MKRITTTVAAAVVLSVAVLFALSLKNIPSDQEGILVRSDGSTRVLKSGLHFSWFGRSKLLYYPVGVHTTRVPESGVIGVIFQDGSEQTIAFEFTLNIPEGSSSVLYESFSENFSSAFQKVVVAAAEIEAANVAADVGQTSFEAVVVSNVNQQLAPVGVQVTRGSLVRFGDAVIAVASPVVSVSADPPRKVLVVGIDGADWLNFEPLFAKGMLPNLKRVVEEGATGPMESIEPLLSPLLWTTMATGKYPEDHGILNFTVVDRNTGRKMPITRHYRKVDAFWNMLGDYGRTVGVSGWLATDPAESVNGMMVTDKVGYVAFADHSGDVEARRSSVYPADRFEDVVEQVVKTSDLTYEEVRQFLQITRSEFADLRNVDYDARNSINNLMLLYATTKTYARLAAYMRDSFDPDVLVVYFELVDAVSHLFMLHAPPKMPDVPLHEFEMYKAAVEHAYVYQDFVLGRLMEQMDDNTVLMVISDHGFKSGGSRLRNRPEIWAGNAAKWHRKNGIVALYGNGIKPGYKIRDATILDVTPTILALQGLPQAEDMPGRPLTQAFEKPLLELMNNETVPTLERRRDGEGGDSDGQSAMSEEQMKKLEALGYVTPDNADAHNNLGQRFQQRGNYDKAIDEYKKAIAMRPDFHSAHNNLAVCYGKLKRYPEAEASLLTAITIKSDDFYAMNNLAVMYIETNQLEKSVAMGQRAVTTEPGYVNGRITLGTALAMTGNFAEAEIQFREALQLEPDNVSAQKNLEILKQKQGSR